MSIRFQKPAGIMAALVVFAATLFGLVVSPAAQAADSMSYTFRFVNGQVISGVSNDKTHFLPNAGGSSADNPTGMEVHLSCSDEFSGGWGEKDGPVQGVDTAWQIASFFIQKGNKTCGTPEPPAPPPDPPAIDIEKFVNGEDADDPTGPEIPVGGTATFTYEVTNTGGVPLRDVEVIDSTLGPIGCPATTLDVGESMSCDEQTETVTEPGQHTMKATVTAIGGAGDGVIPPLPVGVKKAYRFTFVNGITIVGDAKDKIIANAGGSSVTNPTGMKVHLSCSDKFTGGWGQKDGPVQGIDTAWQIASFSITDKGREKCGGTFSDPTPQEVMDMDPVYFIVPPPDEPKIDIEKYVNGFDADTPPGPTIQAGSTARFTYVVTNIGDVPLENVTAVDNVIGPLSCPRSELAIGQSMVCDATEMPAEVGSHTMESCVEGSNDGRVVTDCDPVYWEVPPPPDEPKIDIEKYVNGDDADNPPGPTLRTGSDATFTYVVTNTGDVPLGNITVDDNVIGPITCPRNELGIGESMDCNSTSMMVRDGQHSMESCVSGFNANREVTDCDPVYYTGEKDPAPAGIGDMVTDTNGAPVANVVVDLFSMNGDGSRAEWLGDTRTDPNGIYGFSPGAGCYVVVFIAPTGFEFSGSGMYDQRSTCLVDGEVDNTVDAVLKRLG